MVPSLSLSGMVLHPAALTDMAKLEDIPDDLCCPISRETFRDPVVASDGHTYSREAIENWIEKLSSQNVPLTSPFMRQA